MKIAIIGCNPALNIQLGKSIQMITGFTVIKDEENEMSSLFKMNQIKYFHSYQMHLLLERCRKIGAVSNVVLCDSLFTDMCAINAALNADIISEYEAQIYHEKHVEYADYLTSCDLVLGIHDGDPTLNTVSFGDSNDFPLKFYQECYLAYNDKFEDLRKKTTSSFREINIEQINDITYLRTLLSMPDELDNSIVAEVEQDIQEAIEAPSFQDQFMDAYKMSNINVHMLDNASNIKSMLSNFEQGSELEYERYAAVDAQKIICLRIFDKDEDPSIDCRVFEKISEALEFLE